MKLYPPEDKFVVRIPKDRMQDRELRKEIISALEEAGCEVEKDFVKVCMRDISIESISVGYDEPKRMKMSTVWHPELNRLTLVPLEADYEIDLSTVT